MYSASMVDSAVVGCLCERHATGPPNTLNIYPEVERRVSRQPPQSASA
jgi:hypothetical protein